MAPSPPTGLNGLVGLPSEIMNAIFTEIRGSHETVRALARVCRRLHALANPFVYKSVIIRQPATGDKFAWTIEHAPHLIPLVRELQIHFHGTGDDEPFCIPEDFEPVLAQLVHLESLVVKSDYFDHDEDSNLFCRPGILPALRSCHLGFDYGDESTWILHPYEAVFFHPGLRALTITGACAQTPWTRLTGSPDHRSTQLEELRLLNCDLASYQLSEMLSYPRALKHFTFKGQAPDPIVTGPIRQANRNAYIDVLKSHASSLESMDLDLYFHWKEPIDLREFKALKRLTISRRMLIGDGNEPKSLGDFLPPNLEQLTFRHNRPGFHLGDIYELIGSGALPRLSHFTAEIWSDDSPIQLDWPDGTSTRYSQCPRTHYLENLGVQLSFDRVRDPVMMPENEPCPCPCWSYRHRFDRTYPW